MKAQKDLRANLITTCSGLSLAALKENRSNSLLKGAHVLRLQEFLSYTWAPSFDTATWLADSPSCVPFSGGHRPSGDPRILPRPYQGFKTSCLGHSTSYWWQRQHGNSFSTVFLAQTDLETLHRIHTPSSHISRETLQYRDYVFS